MFEVMVAVGGVALVVFAGLFIFSKKRKSQENLITKHFESSHLCPLSL